MKSPLAIAFMLFCMAAPVTDNAAQEAGIDEILTRAETQRVTMNYACSISELSPVRIRGRLVVQGDCYYAEGYGMRIYCNGGTRWTVDPDNREVYVEDAGGIAEVLLYRDSVTNLKLSDIEYSEPSDPAVFRFDVSALDSTWVITDLRGL